VIVTFRGHTPRLHPTSTVQETAVLIGDVELGPDASVWFGTVIRADIHHVRIGARTNIQDNATIHVTRDRHPTIVGADVTVGHAAIVHGCVVEDGCLVGMGAVVMDGCVIGAESLVGARALVTPGTRIPPRSLVLGSPGKRVREVTDEELATMRAAAANYVALAQEYRASRP
jgi:carbonic anhydrase/acetyltransferase-like protein (isoleucine patch superfamily)